jgi:hypothetical protein
MDACLSAADLKVSAVFFGIPVDFRLSVARACPVVRGIGCPLPVKPPLLFRVATHDYFVGRACHELQPSLAIGEILFAGVLGEYRLQCYDNPPDIDFGAPVAARHKDHAVMPGSAWHDRLVVQWAVVTQVVGDDGPVLSSRDFHDFGI